MPNLRNSKIVSAKNMGNSHSNPTGTRLAKALRDNLRRRKLAVDQAKDSEKLEKSIDKSIDE